jgi:hypothetical protein
MIKYVRIRLGIIGAFLIDFSASNKGQVDAGNSRAGRKVFNDPQYSIESIRIAR